MGSVSATAVEFADFVAPHWPAVVALAVRLCGQVDGEDVAQEALAAAWRQFGRYEPERGSARAWLLMLTAEYARRWARRQRSRPEQAVPVPERAVPQRYGDLDLRRALHRLSERQQLAIALFYYLDLPINEIAAVMGCGAGTVKSTLSDARRRLRALLKESETA